MGMLVVQEAEYIAHQAILSMKKLPTELKLRK